MTDLTKQIFEEWKIDVLANFGKDVSILMGQKDLAEARVEFLRSIGYCEKHSTWDYSFNTKIITFAKA